MNSKVLAKGIINLLKEQDIIQNQHNETSEHYGKRLAEYDTMLENMLNQYFVVMTNITNNKHLYINSTPKQE